MDSILPRKFATTPGTRDVLPPESTRLLDVQGRIRERFKLFGFREVLTPALEYSEVIEEPKLRDAAYKLFDPDNQMVILRPEMTTPIARLVAQRLRNNPTPHKLSYVLPAYRRAGLGRGQSAELYQAGVEVVGSPSPVEDASTISLLIDVLNSLHLKSSADFAVVLGQTAFYEGYLQENVPEATTEILRALVAKDLVRVDALSEGLPEGVSEAVRRIPRLVGSAGDGSILEEAAAYVEPGSRAGEALENLRKILGHLEAYGCLGAVTLDLGLIGRHNYYTGAVYEVYAGGLGFTVANGGRYDNLLRRFGEDLPATGFAISLERLLHVLPEDEPEPLLVLVGGGLSGTRVSRRLRESGVPVVQLAEELEPGDARKYAREVGAAWVCYPAGDTGVELAPVSSVGHNGYFEPVPLEAVAGKVLS